MTRQLGERSSLANLRKEAKRWLRALRENDADARARLARTNPGAQDPPTLRDIQHALAREFGLSGWTELARRLEDRSDAQRDARDVVAWFVQNACPDHSVRGGREHVWALATASRILQRHPDVGRASFYTAVVTGDIAQVRRTLSEDPRMATTNGGPKGWAPLLYLAFTRLAIPAARDNAVAIATLLLDHGADPNAHFMAGDSVYTPLVGVVGEGEEDRPPHPMRDALARLLLERGAEPYDTQVLYNIHFHGRVLWFLELIHEQSLRRGRAADWRDPSWPMLDMGGYGNGARYLMTIAVKHDDLRLAHWLLEHGADPNAPPATDPRHSRRSLLDDALARGELQLAQLLTTHGATPGDAPISGEDEFAATCLLDPDRARAILARHPEYLQSTRAITLAVERDRDDVVRFLLDAGMSPDIADPSQGNRRPLHVAAYADAVRCAELLIERGAEIDPRETVHGATPIGWASHAQKTRMVDLLSSVSRNVWVLALDGRVDRLREVLGADPARARVEENGWTPLMWLPADEERALEVAEILLEHGADPAVVNGDGHTAETIARARALDRVAQRLARKAGA